MSNNIFWQCWLLVAVQRTLLILFFQLILTSIKWIKKFNKIRSIVSSKKVVKNTLTFRPVTLVRPLKNICSYRPVYLFRTIPITNTKKENYSWVHLKSTPCTLTLSNVELTCQTTGMLHVFIICKEIPTDPRRSRVSNTWRNILQISYYLFPGMYIPQETKKTVAMLNVLSTSICITSMNSVVDRARTMCKALSILRPNETGTFRCHWLSCANENSERSTRTISVLIKNPQILFP